MENILKIALKNFKSNKPKITFCEETFKVYEEKGEVYCTLKCKIPDTLFNKENYYTFKGNARVCKGDTFNEEVGKKIARTKAEQKAYLAYRRQFLNLVDNLKQYAYILLKEEDRICKILNHNVDYLNKWL